MDTMMALFVVWGLVTVVLLGLVFYRSRISKKETDWIPLSDDAKEEQAIETQKVSEMKIHKLDVPIHALGTIWVIMLLVIVGYWFYHGIMTPPPVAK
jgi:Na+/glutamate symporter